MAEIIFDNVTFYYTTPYKVIFEDFKINIDTNWKTGIIGRNGRGKSTMFKLIKKEIEPEKGNVIVPLKISCFPWNVSDENKRTRDVIRNFIAPFDEWESEMKYLLSVADELSIAEYGEIEEKYAYHNGYEIDNLIEREFNEMEMDVSLLEKPFGLLSGGEKTRCMIIALFLQKDVYTLIDEPTNHLDIRGREILGRYLSKQKGFLLISHDRYFLDLCVDHIVSLNKADIRVNSGNFSQWEFNMQAEEKQERTQNEKLKREISAMEASSRNYRKWSNAVEKTKAPHADKGYIGAQAAKLMKQAITTERRMESKISEKKDLLKNVEKEHDLKILTEDNIPNVVLSIHNLNAGYDGNILLKDFNLTVRRGDRIAITGKNGCGKTTLFKTILGEIPIISGDINLPGFIKVRYSRQHSEWQTGFLKDRVAASGLDEIVFRNVMGIFNVRGDIFDKPLEEFSEGERKKLELCRTLIEPSTILLWDEPLNYLDISSREKIKEAILEHKPTMLFIEHDRYFVEEVATEIIVL